MDPDNRSKRDLPEVVADILITLDKIVERQDRMEQTQEQMLQTQEQMLQAQEQMLQTQEQMREQMNEGFDRMANSFNHMTNAVLDAMNRQTNRYDQAADVQTTQGAEVRELKQRVENLEKAVYNKAS